MVVPYGIVDFGEGRLACASPKGPLASVIVGAWLEALCLGWNERHQTTMVRADPPERHLRSATFERRFVEGKRKE